MQNFGQRQLIPCAALAFAMAVACGPLQADETTPPEYAAGHGSIGIEFQHDDFHGDFDGPAGKDSGNVSFFVYQLQASYFVADGWEVDLGLPYIESVFSQEHDNMFAHPIISCLSPAGPGPTCRPTLVDDGNYHGTFQDWNAGVRYHFDYNGIQIAPLANLIVPSHNYQYYGSASFGERNTLLGVGAEVSHQLDFSNWFYVGRYEYYFNTHHLGYDNNYYTLNLDVGYFFSPSLSARLLTDVRLGNGITDEEIGATGPPSTNPIWLYHDRFRLQEHALIGGAIDYAFARHYDVQAGIQHAVWGRSNSDLKYELDLKLTRSF